MAAVAFQRVQGQRQRRHQRLAFSGTHLGDAALVQRCAADELHVVMALPDGAAACLADQGEGRNHDVV